MIESKEMDLQEWELVPDDDEGFLEIINSDGGGGNNTIYSSSSFSTTRTSVSHMNYFHYSYCPPPPPEFVQKTGPAYQLILLPPPPPPHDVPIDLKMMPPPPPAEAGGGSQDPVPSPKSRSGLMTTGMPHHHQIEDFSQFDPPPCKQVDVVVVDSQIDLDKGTSNGEKQGGGGPGVLKIWKWSININNGIRGAICSFGSVAAAAATICCIITLRSCSMKHQTKLHPHFQIYTTTNDHKRMEQKQVVHHASEAISTVIRGGGVGVPIISRAAHITFGGYYDSAAAASSSL